MHSQLAMSFREQFFAKHGEHVQTEDGSAFLFVDGAFCSHSPLGISSEPPEEPLPRARMVARYWTEKLRRAVAQFERLRLQLEGQAMAVKRHDPMASAPTDEDIRPLRELQKVVKGLQKRLAAAQADVTKATPKHIEQRAAEQARKDQQADQVFEQITNIRI